MGVVRCSYSRTIPPTLMRQGVWRPRDEGGAGEGFDFIGVDMEHTPINVEGFYHIALAAKGTGCDVLARLPACDAALAKQVLDMGAAGIIVPSVNSPAEAAQSVAMAKFPPEGIRDASLCRATGFGSRFNEYFQVTTQVPARSGHAPE